MKISRAISSLLLGLTCASAAHAGTQTVSFASCSGGTVTTSLSSTSLGPCASLTAGISFAPDAGFDLYIATPGQSANVDTALGVDLPNGGHDNITFASPTTIFDATYNQNFGGGSQSGSPAAFTIDTFLGGNPVGTYNFNVASGSSTVFNITSGPFDFLQVSQAGGYAVLSDITFSTSGAVPEPATWALMLLGFGMVGYALRKRPQVRSHRLSYAIG